MVALCVIMYIFVCSIMRLQNVVTKIKILKPTMSPYKLKYIRIKKILTDVKHFWSHKDKIFARLLSNQSGLH